MAPRTIVPLCASTLVLIVIGGCNQTGGDGDAQRRAAALMLSEEPDGGQTVLDVRYALVGEPEAHDHDHDHVDGAVDHDHAHDHAEDVGDDDPSAEIHSHEHDHGIEGLEHEHEHPVEDGNHAGVNHDPDDDRAEHAHDHEHDDGHEHGDVAGDDEHAAPTAGSMDVVMIGIVGGVTNPYVQSQPDFPFVKGEATVFLADPAFVAEQQATGHQHAPGEECAFCEAHTADAANAIAMVRFVNDAGQPIKTDARDLLSIKQGQTVVVTGVANIEAGDVLVIDARGLYVRE